ncbi:MAG: hypothetical protein HN759_10660 [Akkermansiaceae bacterium]|jgi:hypothetical protein|nr:hypothetical protein [Akkermansiaceae bacterium]
MTQVELESRIQDMFEGVLAEDQWPELHKALLESEEARETYYTYAQIHTLLDQKAQGAHTLTLKTPVIPIDDVIKSQRRKSFRYAALSAAAVVMIGLIVMQMFFIEPKPTGLSIEVSPGSEFSLSHEGGQEAPEEMTMEKGSRLQITQGAVELTFGSGVKSIIMAPADLTMHDDDVLYLNQGTAWFHVPAKAVGFQVKTRDFDIVDLGTEFGVHSSPNHHDEVHIITGKVKVTALRVRTETATLTAGEARRADPVGRLITIPAETSVFMKSLPKSLPYMHWSFDEVADGGFAAEGNHARLTTGKASPRKKSASSMQVDGRFGKAVLFDGQPGEEILTQWKGISGTRPRTVACWIKSTPDVPWQDLDNFIAWGLNKPNYTGWNTKWKFAVEPGLLHVSGYQGRITTKVPEIMHGKWFHVACTHRVNKSGKPEVSLYVNGTLVETQSNSTHSSGIKSTNTITDDPHSDPVIFGADLFTPGHGYRDHFRGLLDEVYIFEGILSASAIKILAQENRYESDPSVQTLTKPISNNSLETDSGS